MAANPRPLGPGGPRVNPVGFGGMYLSLDGRPSEAQALGTLQAALEAGVDFIDTADVYCIDDGEIGHNERLIARALAGRRDVVVASKGGLHRPDGRWTRDGRPQHLARACEASLTALGVEAIDLYQLHEPDPDVPFAESVGALARLREQGKVRAVGLSNVTTEQIEIARRIVPLSSVQNRWNVSDRRPERDGVLAACAAAGIAFIAYSPFGGGNQAPKLGNNARLAAAAAGHGISVHALILAWMLAKSPVVICIPGARQAHNVRDNAWAAEVALSPGDVRAIEATLDG
jgi:aryl-alcohol dehydrogenase-like predicted oxidoreductase